MRHIGPAEGQAMCDSGQASRIYKERQHGKPREFIGYRLRVLIHPPAPGLAMISSSEMRTSAGVNGRSFTAELSEKEKLDHTRKTRFVNSGIEVVTHETEDFIELAQTKVALWPLVVNENATSVMPRASAGDILAAVKLMESLDLQRRLYPNPEG